ncbi:hypothetical protein H4R20_001728 [Coemansia guatemalensis]|uniref:Uncharacterized protein n=1 Tax=Coemansia guatemalensis TaxID=2761395 RepID=A0A9W8HWI6_9FUNG|nr:hypothetical protein H4R20_001728 [Coemansia guatemalensis]
MNQSNPLAAFLITNSLYIINTLAFALKDTKLQEIQPTDVEKICKYFDCINTIECELEWAQQGNTSASNASRKKKKKHGNGSRAQSNGNTSGTNMANTSHSSAPSTGCNASPSAATTRTHALPLN